MTALLTGDKITRDGQYQFNPANSDNELLFNGDEMPQIKMMKLDGLFALPEVQKNDVQRLAGDGAIPGTPFYNMRILTGDIAVIADSSYDMHQQLMDLMEAMQIDDQDGVLIYQKPRLGKRLIYCRPRRIAIPSNSDVIAAGLARGVVEWEAHDPRIYAYYQKTATITIAPGATSASTTAHMAGNWRRGVPCVVEINGPGELITVTNTHFYNRSIRITGTMASNETYLLDTKHLTVTDVGTGESRLTRLDPENQWWQLVKGDNTITANRQTTAGTMIVKIYWRDAFVL